MSPPGLASQDANIYPRWYQHIYGDIESAALFIRQGSDILINLARTGSSLSNEFYSFFESGKVDDTAVINQLHWTFRTANAEADPHLKALKAVSTATK